MCGQPLTVALPQSAPAAKKAKRRRTVKNLPFRGASAQERFRSRRVDTRSFALLDRPMEKALAYVISAGIVGFGAWILIAGLSSSAPALWACAALVPVTVGFLSAFSPK